MISVAGLTKTYRVPLKEPGLRGSFKALVDRKYREIRAVDDIAFDIQWGERVGFLGPNGAGKTTTLKMLCGLLHPTSGKVEVAGFVPKERHDAFLRTITLVMGQKQQLLWDLPPSETFAYLKALFDIKDADFKASRDELTDLLGLASFIDQPSRNLSLGQRMRAELAAALLHRPRVLFLDEPTIGLDVEVQVEVRKFIDAYNKRHGATIMLTSHDMQDVAAIADRVILIDKGQVRFDGPLDELARRFGAGRQVRVKGAEDLDDLGFKRDEDRTWVLAVDPMEVNRLLSEVLRRAPQADVSVVDPPLEDALVRAFGQSRKDDAAAP